MNRWLVSLLMLLVVGCGDSSNSNRQSVEELDGGGDGVVWDHSAGGIDLEEMKKSPLFHEFDVDLFSSEPIQRAVTFTVSNVDTYKISLKTLDYLMEEKRFPLVQSNNLIHKGLPKVIAPIGYSVSLEVSGNQIVAIIKSTTSAEMTTRPVPFSAGNNDIIVGDLSAINLLLSGIQKDLNQPMVNGLSVSKSATALNRYLSYNHGGAWYGQLSTTRNGIEAYKSAQVGKQWDMLDLGMIQLSGQVVYSMRDSKHINALSFKYSSPLNDSGFQGHIIVSTLFNSPFHAAVGLGCQRTFNHGRLSIGTVISPLDVNVTVDYVINF